MKINTSLTSFILLASTFGLGVLALNQCSSNNDYKEANEQLVADTLRLYASSNRFARLYAECQTRASETRSYASRLTARLNESMAAAGRQIEAMNQAQQRVDVVKGLVANGSLNSSRLIDTVLVDGAVKVDSELVVAVAKTTKWLAIYKNQSDSLQQAVGAYQAQVSGLEEQVDQCGQRIATVRDALLDEAETNRFLGVGRKKAMRRLSKGLSRAQL